MTTAPPPPGSPTARPPVSVLLSSVSSDSHTWNLVYLELLLTELGCRVHNLGPCVPDHLLLDACGTLEPDLVVLSSVNGHGALDGERVVGRLRAQRVSSGPRVVIGGMLGTQGGAGERERARRLTAAGFDAVFEGPDAVVRFREYLELIRLIRSPRPAGAADRAEAAETAGATGAAALAGTGAMAR
ncbi:cobalamin B12-binding domain-containing protein [Streptomyces sp. NPDC020800]|uniref:cobalamin B12-binding domain-containing protein n=1 Tax=Streptomyces sp. NPDC020800 TaxID=3365092 RepID=UPI0037A7FE16